MPLLACISHHLINLLATQVTYKFSKLHCVTATESPYHPHQYTDSSTTPPHKQPLKVSSAKRDLVQAPQPCPQKTNTCNSPTGRKNKTKTKASHPQASKTHYWLHFVGNTMLVLTRKSSTCSELHVHLDNTVVLVHCFCFLNRALHDHFLVNKLGNRVFVPVRDTVKNEILTSTHHPHVTTSQ